MQDAITRDLPDRFGPMTVKELRQGMRRGSFVVPFLAIQLLAVLAMTAEFQAGDLGSFTEHPGLLNVALLSTSGPFWIVVASMCAVIMPLGGMVLMGQELDEGNHELLLLTELSRWKVVRGKFFTLWGLSALTFVSLLPYVVVRYLVGGIEPLTEIACSASVIALGGMVSAGAIGASSFRTLLGRVSALCLFLGSMVLACTPPLMASALMKIGFPIFYHINALAAFACFTMLGLTLARSRLRLVVHAYEVKPSWMVIGLLVFTPPVVWMATAMTAGYGGFVGLIGMGLVAYHADVTPKAPKSVPAPAPNVPGAEGSEPPTLNVQSQTPGEEGRGGEVPPGVPEGDGAAGERGTGSDGAA